MFSLISDEIHTKNANTVVLVLCSPLRYGKKMKMSGRERGWGGGGNGHQKFLYYTKLCARILLPNICLIFVL